MNGLTLLRSALTQFRFTQKRSFGSAAVQLYDYSDDEDDNEYNMIRNQVQISESERSVSEKGVQWVFIGNPGAKKHLYAEKLSQLLQVPHISMGSLVRQELNPRSSLYKQIANAISEGKLVHEDVIFGLLSKRLEEGYCRGETGFILDGIPRNRMQAEILDQIADIDLVVNFKCSSDCWLKKHLGGSICIHCEASLAMQSPGSTNLNWLMQQSQLKPLIAEDVQKEKLRLYAEQKKPLEDYYRERKKLIDFQVASGPKDTWQGLLSALHLKHMNAVSSSNKLTV